MALFHSIWTVVLFVLFIGIVWWAFSRKRKQDFDAAAHLPLKDDELEGIEDRKHRESSDG